MCALHVNYVHVIGIQGWDLRNFLEHFYIRTISGAKSNSTVKISEYGFGLYLLGY